MIKSNGFLARTFFVSFVLGVVSPRATAADMNEDKNEKAAIEVDGLGWWRDRQQQQSLTRLLGSERAVTLEANAIEDAVFLLLSALTEDGYLAPVIHAEVVGLNGESGRFTFDSSLESNLPRDLAARRVRLRVEEGVRYVFEEIRFSGLQALEEEVARQFFVGEAVLLSRRATRIYSPSRLRTAATNLERELQRPAMLTPA